MPYDYARYSSYGLRHLLEKQGFVLLRHEKLGSFMDTIAYLFVLYVFCLGRRWFSMYALYVLLWPVTAWCNLWGLLGSALPKEKSLYFNQIVLVQKKECPSQ